MNSSNKPSPQSSRDSAGQAGTQAGTTADSRASNEADNKADNKADKKADKKAENKAHNKADNKEHAETGTRTERSASDGGSQHAGGDADTLGGPAMQGEGNYTAARRHRQSAEDFIEGGGVEQAARDAAPETERQSKQLRDAEKAGLAPARH